MTLRQIREVGKLTVVDLDAGDVLGTVLDWVVNAKEQKVVAYVLKKAGWLGKSRVVLTADIIEYGPRMLIVANSESIVNPQEVVRLPEMIAARENLIGYEAEEEGGRKLGRVRDFLFDIADSTVQRYYIAPTGVRGVLTNDLVLTRSQVVDVNGRRIIFRLNPHVGARVPKTATSASRSA